MTGILFQALIAGLGTCLGAAIVLAFGQMKDSTLSLFLGSASGVMGAVVVVDLLPTSLHIGGAATCLLGFFSGFLLVAGLDYYLNRLLPGRSAKQLYLRMGYLIALGIALHDLPEGIAIAAGYFTSSILGPVLALAIGLHNVPEGMATAAPLRAGGMSGARVLAINMLVSMVTPAGTLIGLLILGMNPSFNSLLLALAAGAMIYIVLEKLVPVSLGKHRLFALSGMIVGFWFMYKLNLLF